MKSRIAAGIAFVAICTAVSAQTADEIVNKVIAARGGAEKAKSIHTRRITGHISMPQGGDAELVSEWKRPGRMRMDFTVQGMTAIRAVDGNIGWHLMPFQGDTVPKLINGNELATTQEDADMDGPLLDYRAKGNKLELAGKADFNGKQTLDMKVLLPDGNTHHYYVDPDTWFIVGVRKPSESGADVEGVISDYRDVQGLKFPFSNIVRQIGSNVSQIYKVDKIELNIPIEDSRFQMPTTAQEQNPATKP